MSPPRIYVGGEITDAWPLIEPALREALASRVLTAAAAATPATPYAGVVSPRLRGATALVAAPAFAAPRIG